METWSIISSKSSGGINAISEFKTATRDSKNFKNF
ncbi:unnamed protein product [Schistosoma curassoni]|uniref:Uncharacterized protein n=1 Tax=Schistosoma curassoni TaxID=6186 RepID=A0A183JPX4_9TREM|nr:unnamed protein product [Schistosoma curassoni]